ncbi:putative membrane transporter protein [Gammaproteobacteria bacterium]
MTTIIFLGYASLGACTGILAGLLGVGGGLVIVPVLVMLFQDQGMNSTVVVHLAIGTSLATIVMTSLSSVYAHHQQEAVLWPVAYQLAPGIVVGSWLGARVVHFLPTTTLKIIFGLFELLVAAKIGFGLRPRPGHQLPGRTAMSGVGGFIGLVSGIVGIGGGVLTVPFLTWCNISIRNAVATSAACGIPIAVAGSLGFAVTGWSLTTLPPYSTGYIHWPALLGVTSTSVLTAPLGARLAHGISTTVLTRLFVLLLIFFGVRMLLSV